MRYGARPRMPPTPLPAWDAPWRFFLAYAARAYRRSKRWRSVRCAERANRCVVTWERWERGRIYMVQQIEHLEQGLRLEHGGLSRLARRAEVAAEKLHWAQHDQAADSPWAKKSEQ